LVCTSTEGVRITTQAGYSRLSTWFIQQQFRLNYISYLLFYFLSVQLVERGYGVQLEHEADKPDFVELIQKSDMTPLSRDDTFQHNANYHNRESGASELLEKMEIKLSV